MALSERISYEELHRGNQTSYIPESASTCLSVFLNAPADTRQTAQTAMQKDKRAPSTLKTPGSRLPKDCQM